MLYSNQTNAKDKKRQRQFGIPEMKSNELQN